MRKSVRRDGRGGALTTALTVLLAVLAAVLAAPAVAANVLWVGGTRGTLGRLVPAGTFGTTADLLGGAFKNDTVTTIDYPGSLWPITWPTDPTLGRSVSIGTAHLESAAKTTPGPLVMVGTSQGAMVVQRAEADLNDDPSVPSDTTFVLIADPNAGLLRGLHGVPIPVLDYTPAPLPETRFNTVVVINQYDGFADPIRRPWNLLTDANALMGVVYVHPFAQNSDLSTVPPQDITTVKNSQNGTTTTYRVPTKQLPLTRPMRQLGVPDAVVDRIDSKLRPIIDRGYRQSAAQPNTARPAGSTHAKPAVGH